VISSEHLETLIGEGSVTTVVVCIPDLQGRLMGKRLTGRFWLDVAAHEGIEMCDYLIANDTDMNPVPGYRFASYDLGYGDMVARPDMSTIRLLPWLDRTALVLCDVLDVDTGAPIEESPRRVLQRQVERAAAAGLAVKLGSEIEFFLFRDSFEEAKAKHYEGLRPHSDWVLDYHVLQTSRDEYVVGAIRDGLAAAGLYVEGSKGEAGVGQHELNLRYDHAVPMADANTVYKNGAKEIAASLGRSVTFMAKWDAAHTGSSCHIHSSVWDAATDTPLMPDADGHASDLSRWWMGGLLATARELSILFAPNVNSYKRFQPMSWAPTALVWGEDNRTVGFRRVGHGSGLRVESRIPGSDANSYLAFAATIAGGLHGIANRIEPGDDYRGNGYDAVDVPRLPTSLDEAARLFADSELAAAAFGADVHHHLVNFAVAEWNAYSAAVTDWERVRYFERW
jgi:glutamine synthetase